MFLDEHDKIQRAPTDEPNCKREKVVAALMFWSDATGTFPFAHQPPVLLTIRACHFRLSYLCLRISNNYC